MKTIKFLVLLMILLSLFSVSVIADDTSCELKKDTHKEMSNGSTNEFTRDKTWRFRVDDDLVKDDAAQNEDAEDKPVNRKASATVGI